MTHRPDKRELKKWNRSACILDHNHMRAKWAYTKQYYSNRSVNRI